MNDKGRVNGAERIAELRRHATAHQGARSRSGGDGYSVIVRSWEPDGSTSETVGFIAATNLDSVRIAVLARLGGGFKTLPFWRMASIERAPFVAEAKP